jgi:glycosyltransferase involved in cell wall biosynthesis
MNTPRDADAEDPLRVALLTRAEPGSPRDPHAYAVALAAALRAAGAQVHLFSDQPPAADRSDLPYQAVMAPPAEAGDAVAAARAYCSALVPLIGRVSQDRGSFHVLHACGWTTAPAALSVRRHGGARAVVTFLDTVFGRAGHCNGDRATAHIRNLEQQAAREADLVIAANESVRAELAWLYDATGERVRVVPDTPLAADVTAPRLARAATPCLGFVGPWNHDGGSDLFLEVARLMALEQPGLRVVVAADAIAPAKLESDLRRRGLGDRRADTAGLADPLAACDVVLASARRPVGHHGLYRARALGLPVVVTRTGPAELVEPGRTGSVSFPFAAALLTDVKKWLSDTAPAVPSASFTWSHAAINLIAYYRALFAGGEVGTEKLNDVSRSR